jgi:hypothetical protein
MRWAGGPVLKGETHAPRADAVLSSASPRTVLKRVNSSRADSEDSSLTEPLAAGCLFRGDLWRRDDTSQCRLSSAARARRRRVARCGRWNLAAIEFQDKQANGRR